MNNRYTLKQVAKLAGCSESSLIRWERLGFIERPARVHPRTKARMYVDDELAVIKEFVCHEGVKRHSAAASSSKAS